MAIAKSRAPLEVFETENELPLGWYLLRFGEGKKMVISLKSDSLLGRKVIYSKRISNHHAFIRFLDDGSIHILDLKSKGGTYVNDVRIPEGGMTLNEWDIICLGRRRPRSGDDFGFFLRLKDSNESGTQTQEGNDSEMVAKSSSTSVKSSNGDDSLHVHVPLARKKTSAPTRTKKMQFKHILRPRVFLDRIADDILHKHLQKSTKKEKNQPKSTKPKKRQSEESSARSASSESKTNDSNGSSDSHKSYATNSNSNSASTVKLGPNASTADNSRVTEKNVKRLPATRKTVNSKEKVKEWLLWNGYSTSSSSEEPSSSKNRKPGRYTDDSVYENSLASEDKASDSEADWKVSKKRRRAPSKPARRGKRRRRADTESSYSTCESAFGSLKDFVVPDDETEEESSREESSSKKKRKSSDEKTKSSKRDLFKKSRHKNKSGKRRRRI